MASLKVLRRRIRSVTSTQQITKAMEMVAAAKLRRAQARALSMRPYAAKLTGMLENLAAVARERELPLFEPREVRTTALVVVTSDRGLCGGYNTNLFRAVEDRLREAADPRPAGAPAASAGTAGANGAALPRLVVVVVGRKGREYARRRGWPVLGEFGELGADATVETARAIAGELLRRFESREVDKVEILYTRFFSALRRRVTCDTFLPIGAEPSAGRSAPPGDIILEPSLEAIFEALLPRFAGARMLAALADARASEEGARMTAMGAATENAGELLETLVLQRNRLRQLMITREILDIVGGAEALR